MSDVDRINQSLASVNAQLGDKTKEVGNLQQEALHLNNEHRQKLVDLDKKHSDNLQEKQQEIQDALDKTLWNHRKYFELFEDMSGNRAVLPDDWSSWFPFFLCVGVFLVCMVCMVIHFYVTCLLAKLEQKRDSIREQLLECADHRRDQSEIAHTVTCFSTCFHEITARPLQSPGIMLSHVPKAGCKLDAATYMLSHIQSSISPASRDVLCHKVRLIINQQKSENWEQRFKTASTWWRRALRTENAERVYKCFNILTAARLSKKWVDTLKIDHGDEPKIDHGGYPRLCSYGALQTTYDIWGNWTAGASHAGDSFSLGLLADKGLIGSPYSQHGIL